MKRTLLKYAALALCGMPVLAQAQMTLDRWETRQEFTEYSISDVSLLEGSDVAYATGSQSAGDLTINAVLRSDDGGATWAPIDFPDGNDIDVAASDFIAPGVGAVVTEDMRLFRLRDGSGTWTESRLPLEGDATAIQFVNERMVVVAGQDDRNSEAAVAISYNGGASWADRSFTDSIFSIGSVYFVDSLTGYLGGSRSRTLAPTTFRTTDGGLTWTEHQLTGSFRSFGFVNGFGFSDADNGWAAVQSLYDVGGVFRTRDGGLTWTEEYNTGLPYNRLVMNDAGVIAIVASNTSSRASLQVSPDGGDTWGELNLAVKSQSRAIDIEGDRILVGQNYSSLVVSDDAGQSITQTQYAATIEGIAWRDSTTGHAVSGFVAGGPPRTLTTTDGGASWSVDQSIPGGRDIYLEGDNLYTFFPGRTAYLNRSTDGGATFRRHNLMVGSGFLEGIAWRDAEFGLAHGGDGTVQFSSNGGRSWSFLNAPTSDYIDELEFAGARAVMGGGFGGGNGFLFYSDNNGLTWTASTMPIDNMVLGLDFADERIGLASTFDGPILRTEDGGESWIEVGLVPHEQPQTLVMIDEDRAYVVARNKTGGADRLNGNGFVYETLDGGFTWEQVFSRDLPNSSLGAIGIQPDARGTVWVGGQHTYLGRGFNSATVGTREPSIVEESLAMSPNPTSAEVYLSFDLPTAGDVRVELYDAVGRQVTQRDYGSLEVGTQVVRFEPNVSSGHYVVRVRTAEGSAARKLMVR